MAARHNLDLDKDQKSIIATRIFDAPRDLVFEVWTDPKHIAQWWGPNGFTTTTRTFEMRAGGIWRFVMHGPDGQDYQNRITYDEIVKPERIVYHHGGGEDVDPVQFRVVVTFEDMGRKTRLTMRMEFPSAAERKRVIDEYGAGEGLVQTLSRLGDYVVQLERPVESDGDATAEREFVITRIFDAPRDLVWQAHTECRHLMHWWGPKGFKMKRCNVDLRPGGLFHYCMEMPNGGEMWGKFVYREIVEPERIVYISAFSDEAGGTTRHPLGPGWPLELLSTLTFEPASGDKTRVTVRWSPHNATEEERGVFNAGFRSMQQGWTGTMDQLADYLAGLSG